MTYSPGQAKALFPHWPKEAEWFVIGGPADGDEAQTVRIKYPHVWCVGFEPNRELFKYQLLHGFPGPLFDVALWSRAVPLTLQVPTGRARSSSVFREFMEDTDTHVVQAVALDDICETMDNIVLWLDIEGAEKEALLGAKKTLKRTLLINLESLDDDVLHWYDNFLANYGFRRVDTWNTSAVNGMCDAIYRRM